MAATKLIIQNSADKSFKYAHVIGEGAPATGDTLLTDLKSYPIGSEYIDTVGKAVYFRVANEGSTTDWIKLVPAA